MCLASRNMFGDFDHFVTAGGCHKSLEMPSGLMM